MTEDALIPKVLDVSLVTGSPNRLARATRYNKLRSIINKENICWRCREFGSQCNSVAKIFSCPKIKHLTSKLNKEDYYETSI